MSYISSTCQLLLALCHTARAPVSLQPASKKSASCPAHHYLRWPHHDLRLPALQSTCCLPEPWTKHITAPKQHGIFLYLPTATPVLPPDAPLLRHPSHTHTHTHTHSPHHAHLNECTEGCGDVQGNKPPPPHPTEDTLSAAVCSVRMTTINTSSRYRTITPVLETPL